MNKHDFWFDLPPGLIAQSPEEKRDHSRLLCLSGEGLAHKHFYDLPDMLNAGDCLVLNNSKVLPARLLGTRESGASAEVLLLNDLGSGVWECLVRPGRRLKEGSSLFFGNGELHGEIIRETEDGNRHIRFSHEGVFLEVLDRLGEMPLPPYITRKLEEKDRYQTVYAKESGSAAAPTAGLHFTPELLDRIRQKSVAVAEITLHVGLGTFRPVKTERVEDHKMHSEYYSVSSSAAETINSANGRIVAVGTTACRTLESCAGADSRVQAGSGWTDIFITPGYSFKVVDALVTNFHLPESTLIMLISALAGRERILEAYEEAVRQKYRFFSFGDAMLIEYID